MFHVPKSTRIGLGTWNIVFLNSLKKTQALQKNNFSSSEKLFFFAHAWTAHNPHKNQYPHIDFCVDCEQSKHARKKQFFGAWKIVFLQSLRFLQAIEENNVSGPQAYPHVDFGWIGSSPSMREKTNLSELEKLFVCKAQFHPVRQYKGSRQKNEPQRGIANLTYKQ